MNKFNNEEWNSFLRTFDARYEPEKPDFRDNLITIMKLCFIASCLLCALFVLS